MEEIDLIIGGIIIGIIIGVAVGLVLSERINNKPQSILFDRDKEGRIVGMHYVVARPA